MDSDNKERWMKNCPKCGRGQIYSSEYTLRDAILHNKRCNKCRWDEERIKVPIEGWVKKCSKCGRERVYSCKGSLTLAAKRGTLCNSCQASTKKAIPPDGGWTRQCKNCGRKMVYSCKKSYILGYRTNSKCRRCVTKEVSETRDMSWAQSPEYKTKMSIALKSVRNTDKYGEKFRQKCRENKQKQIQQQGIQRTYNPVACKFMNQFNLKFGTKLQHGMNGGECQFVGYSLDGYDKENNIVFEYDEPKHHVLTVRQKDNERQKRLIECLRPNRFFRYDEKYNRLIDVITNTEVLWQTQ